MTSSIAPRRAILLTIVCIVALLRTALCFYGYDRRPLASSNDEVVIQDAPLSWARGQGLRLASFEGLELAKFYAHYPPVYTVTQAALYRVFGFSMAVVRLPGIIYSLIGLLFTAGILIRWQRAGLLDAFGAWTSGILLLIDPFIAVVSRVGRMEPMAMMFGVMGIYFITDSGSNYVTTNRMRLIASGVLVGLALATHVAAVAYWVMFVGLIITTQEQIKLSNKAVLASLPIAVLTLIWIAVYRERSVEGIHQMVRISRTLLPPSFGFRDLAVGLLHSNQDLIKKVGGTAFLLLWAGWLFALARPFIPTDESSSNSRRMLITFAVVAVIQIFIGWKLSLYVARTFLFLPLALLFFAAAISHMSRVPSRIIVVGCVIFATAQFSLFAQYYRRLPGHWNEWSPNRFDDLVHSIPENQRILSSYELWHAFMKADRPVRITDFTLVSDRQLIQQHPDLLETYDVAILNDETRQLASRSALFTSGWVEKKITDDDETFFIEQRKVLNRTFEAR